MSDVQARAMLETARDLAAERVRAHRAPGRPPAPVPIGDLDRAVRPMVRNAEKSKGYGRPAPSAGARPAAVYRIPKGALVPRWNASVPEVGCWRLLADACLSLFVAGCIRTDGKAWRMMGDPHTWPHGLRDRRTVRRYLAVLTGEQTVTGPDGKEHRIPVWRTYQTTDGQTRYEWTERGRALFFTVPWPGAKPRRRPQYAQVPAPLIDSGAYHAMRPGTRRCFPFVQWLARRSCGRAYGSHGPAVVGWYASHALLASLAGCSRRTARRALTEMVLAGLLDVARRTGDASVYTFQGALRVADRDLVVLSDRWRDAIAGFDGPSTPGQWRRHWLLRLGRLTAAA